MGQPGLGLYDRVRRRHAVSQGLIEHGRGIGDDCADGAVQRHPCGGGYLGDRSALCKVAAQLSRVYADGVGGYCELVVRETPEQQAHRVGAPLADMRAPTTGEEKHVDDAKRSQTTQQRPDKEMPACDEDGPQDQDHHDDQPAQGSQ